MTSIGSKPLLYTSLIGSGDWEWTALRVHQSLALITTTLGPLT